MADENKTERVQLLMTPSEVKAIDDWSFENRIRGRAEAMRRLCQIGLGLDARCSLISKEYNKIGASAEPVMKSLQKLVISRDINDFSVFAQEFAQLINRLADHSQALTELVAASGTIKAIDQFEPPSFDSAMNFVQKAITEIKKQAKKEKDVSEDDKVTNSISSD